MLDNLDDIPWSDFHHAHGNAEEVPGLIRSLLIRDNHQWTIARNKLGEAINHQGSVYQCTPYVIPFLFDLISDESVLNRHLLIYDIVSIAIGLDCDYLPYGFNLSEFRKAFESQVQSLSAEERTESIMGPHIDLECYERINARADKLVMLLSDQSSEVRIASSFAISWFPECSSGIEQLADMLLRVEQLDHVELLNIILAYGLFAYHRATPVEVDLLLHHLEHRELHVRVATAIAISKSVLNRRVIETLKVGANAKQLEDVFELSRFNEGRLQDYAKKVLQKVLLRWQ